MAFTLPKLTDYVLQVGDRGIVVWSLQRACNRLAIPTKEDGDFGPKTQESTKALQRKLGVDPQNQKALLADGIAGPATQRSLSYYICSAQEINHDLPVKLLFSKVSYESSNYLGAVNWSVPGGVDVCFSQRRVYEYEYDIEARVLAAFDAVHQIAGSGAQISSLYGTFFNTSSRKGTYKKHELSLRVTVLNHNYPNLADKVSRVGVSGLSFYYTTPQSWVYRHGLKFPDGHPIRTPLEWGQRYSLGNSTHNEPGQACKLVTDWSRQ